jgi:hypothetical protein
MTERVQLIAERHLAHHKLRHVCSIKTGGAGVASKTIYL